MSSATSVHTTDDARFSWFTWSKVYVCASHVMQTLKHSVSRESIMLLRATLQCSPYSCLHKVYLLAPYHYQLTNSTVRWLKHQFGSRPLECGKLLYSYTVKAAWQTLRTQHSNFGRFLHFVHICSLCMTPGHFSSLHCIMPSGGRGVSLCHMMPSGGGCHHVIWCHLERAVSVTMCVIWCHIWRGLPSGEGCHYVIQCQNIAILQVFLIDSFVLFDATLGGKHAGWTQVPWQAGHTYHRLNSPTAGADHSTAPDGQGWHTELGITVIDTSITSWHRASSMCGHMVHGAMPVVVLCLLWCYACCGAMHVVVLYLLWCYTCCGAIPVMVLYLLFDDLPVLSGCAMYYCRKLFMWLYRSQFQVLHLWWQLMSPVSLHFLILLV